MVPCTTSRTSDSEAPTSLSRVGKTGNHSLTRIIGRGSHFAHMESAVPHLGNNIGERTADIAADMYLDTRHKSALTI